MKRITTLFALLFLLFLASCGAAEPDTAVTSPNDSADSGNGETAVSIPSFTPAQNVADAAQLRPEDYTHGAAEPVVTIIEYGDFQ
jgi:hypothetical protein